MFVRLDIKSPPMVFLLSMYNLWNPNEFPQPIFHYYSHIVAGITHHRLRIFERILIMV